jgi:predicted MFS family arabinose efflux permease
MVVVSLLVLNFNVIVPLVARNVLNQDAHGFGLLMSSLGAGAVAGAFGVALFRRGQPPLAFLVASGALLCAGLAALAAVSHFFLAALVLALLGCCQILFTTGCNTTLQLIAPNELRGRVMGLYTVTFAGMTPFGSLLIGWVAEHQGIRMACAAGGAIGLLGVAVLVLIGYRGGIAWTHGRAV